MKIGELRALVKERGLEVKGDARKKASLISVLRSKPTPERPPAPPSLFSPAKAPPTLKRNDGYAEDPDDEDVNG